MLQPTRSRSVIAREATLDDKAEQAAASSAAETDEAALKHTEGWRHITMVGERALNKLARIGWWCNAEAAQHVGETDAIKDRRCEGSWVRTAKL